MKQLTPTALLLLATLLPPSITSAAAPGTAGGYQLYSPEGNVLTTPDSAQAAIDPKSILTSPPPAYENGNQLVAAAVTRAELFVRKAPPPNATNVQLQQLAATKQQLLQTLVDHLPGRGVNISFEVLDVVNRPPPVAPPPPDPNKASLQERQQYAAELERYEQDRAAFEHTRMMVIGRIPWSSPTVLGAEFRHGVAQANAASRDRAAETNDRLTKRLTPDQRRAIQQQRKEQLTALRDAADEDKPVQMIYLLGSNDAFAHWKRGQTRSAHAVIQCAAAFIYHGSQHDPAAAAATRPTDTPHDATTLWQEDLSAAYVGLELACLAAPDAPTR